MYSTMMNSDFAKHLRGESNLSDTSAQTSAPKTAALVETAMHASRCGRAALAEGVLNTLREIRDNQPLEWDILIKSPSGALLCNLWDTLKVIEKGGSSGSTD